MQDIDQTFEGDNSVMMQQVSKALLDLAAKSPPQPQKPQISDSNLLMDPQTLQKLLQFRCFQDPALSINTVHAVTI